MQCFKCGDTLYAGWLCKRCFPPTTGSCYQYLVPKAGDPTRSSSTCLELAIQHHKLDQIKLFYSAMFSPRGSGPFFCDSSVEMMVRRMAHSIMDPGNNRWATLFRRGRPVFTHMDLDDTRELMKRPAEKTLVATMADMWMKFMSDHMQVIITPDDWLVCSTERKNKTSVHMHATCGAFKSISDLYNCVQKFKQWLAELLQDQDHPGHQAASILCWTDEEGNIKHVLDSAPLHHNGYFNLES